MKRSLLLKNDSADKWLEWKNAETQGRLLELPCAVGDTIYQLRNNTDSCHKCEHIASKLFCSYCTNDSVIDKYESRCIEEPELSKTPLCGKQFLEIIEHKATIGMIIEHLNDFGETFFVTREDAENILNERKRAGRKYTIYAVDFDGTLCESVYPGIGEPNTALIDHLIKRKKQGNKVILWTCRYGNRLLEAVDWCREQGLEFDAVNENLPYMIEWYGNDSRKIGADVYIDDRALNKSKYNIPYKSRKEGEENGQKS